MAERAVLDEAQESLRRFLGMVASLSPLGMGAYVLKHGEWFDAPQEPTVAASPAFGGRLFGLDIRVLRMYTYTVMTKTPITLPLFPGFDPATTVVFHDLPTAADIDALRVGDAIEYWPSDKLATRTAKLADGVKVSLTDFDADPSTQPTFEIFHGSVEAGGALGAL